MPRINGLVPIGRRSIFWQMIDPGERNKDLLVVAVPGETLESVLEIWRFGAIDWIGIPEDLHAPWIFDLDAIREGLDQDLSAGFPGWARGKASVPPRGGPRFEITEEDVLREPQV